MKFLTETIKRVIILILIIPCTILYTTIKVITAAYYNGKHQTLNRKGAPDVEEEKQKV